MKKQVNYCSVCSTGFYDYDYDVYEEGAVVLERVPESGYCMKLESPGLYNGLIDQRPDRECYMDEVKWRNRGLEPSRPGKEVVLSAEEVLKENVDWENPFTIDSIIRSEGLTVRDVPKKDEADNPRDPFNGMYQAVERDIRRKESMNTPADNPKDRVGQSKPSMHLVPVDGIIQVAEVMKLGAEKYGPYNWRSHSVLSTVYLDAMYRHIAAYLDGQNLDPESGQSHMAHAAACALIMLDAEANGNLKDDRPVAGRAAELIEEAIKKLESEDV